MNFEVRNRSGYNDCIAFPERHGIAAWRSQAGESLGGNQDLRRTLPLGRWKNLAAL
jgi:hypothetical protein